MAWNVDGYKYKFMGNLWVLPRIAPFYLRKLHKTKQNTRNFCVSEGLILSLVLREKLAAHLSGPFANEDTAPRLLNAISYSAIGLGSIDAKISCFELDNNLQKEPGAMGLLHAWMMTSAAMHFEKFLDNIGTLLFPWPGSKLRSLLLVSGTVSINI